jgi:hypothetical protein
MSTEAKDLRAQIDELHRRAGGATTGERRSDFTEAQSRAQATYDSFDQEAPSALAGESLTSYRIRLLSPFKQHSSKYANSDLSAVGDPGIFDAVEQEIYRSASKSRNDSQNFRPGELRPVRTRDQTGRTITSFRGDPLAAWAAFSPRPRYARFLTPNVR